MIAVRQSQERGTGTGSGEEIGAGDTCGAEPLGEILARWLIQRGLETPPAEPDAGGERPWTRSAPRDLHGRSRQSA